MKKCVGLLMAGMVLSTSIGGNGAESELSQDINLQSAKHILQEEIVFDKDSQFVEFPFTNQERLMLLL